MPDTDTNTLLTAKQLAAIQFHLDEMATRNPIPWSMATTLMDHIRAQDARIAAAREENERLTNHVTETEALLAAFRAGETMRSVGVEPARDLEGSTDA